MVAGDPYVLKDRVAVPATDEVEWAIWFGNPSNRIVKQDTIGESLVSTVFLGIEHQFETGAPILFETMVFGGDLDEKQERYSSWEDAEIGHEAMCGMVATAIIARRLEKGTE
jgi:hypothetical protein